MASNSKPTNTSNNSAKQTWLDPTNHDPRNIGRRLTEQLTEQLSPPNVPRSGTPAPHRQGEGR